MSTPNNLPIKIYRTDDTVELSIIWEIFNKCNYNCSYCFSYGHHDKKINVTLEHAICFIDRIVDHYMAKLNYKKIIISITGGEPTIWKDLVLLCEYAYSKNIYVGITSNGSAPIIFWEKHSHFFDFICLSYHPEHCSPVDFVEKYKVICAQKNTVLPAARIMMHRQHNYWERSIKVYEMIKQLANYQVECVAIQKKCTNNTWLFIPYESETMNDFIKNTKFEFHLSDHLIFRPPEALFNHKLLRQNYNIEKLIPNDLINEHSNKFTNWSCHIGLEQLFINASGEIYRATCLQGDLVGLLKNCKDIPFPSQPIICKKEFCHCTSDISISKSTHID